MSSFVRTPIDSCTAVFIEHSPRLPPNSSFHRPFTRFSHTSLQSPTCQQLLFHLCCPPTNEFEMHPSLVHRFVCRAMGSGFDSFRPVRLARCIGLSAEAIFSSFRIRTTHFARVNLQYEPMSCRLPLPSHRAGSETETCPSLFDVSEMSRSAQKDAVFAKKS